MIRHCVFINFKNDVDAKSKSVLLEEIRALSNHLCGIKAVHVGGNVSPETGMDKGFSDGFIVDFDNATARDEYLHDAGHKAVGAKLVAAAEGGVAGILVYDLELI